MAGVHEGSPSSQGANYPAAETVKWKLLPRRGLEDDTQVPSGRQSELRVSQPGRTRPDQEVRIRNASFTSHTHG